MGLPSAPIEKGEGSYNRFRERCSDPRAFRDTASHLKRNVSTLDAVSCTGALPNRGSLNHGDRCGEDESGEVVCARGN